MDEYSVYNCTPTVPVDMCSHCPLDIDNVEFHAADSTENTSGCNPGDFINCGRMFKIDSNECKGSLYKWAEDTPCDDVLPAMLQAYYVDNPGDTYNLEKDKAGQILDRYVYTMCEQCCDCIPCTPETDTLEPLIDDALLPIDVYRHNCPLHWVFDVCGIYPDIEYRGPLPLTYYNASDVIGEAIDIAEEIECALKEEDGTCTALDVCDLTRKYRSAESSNNTEGVDSIFNEQGLAEALDYYMKAWGCAKSRAWRPCHQMEYLMGRQTPGHPNC